MKWRKVSLGEVCELRYGKSLVKETRVQEGPYPVYGSSGIVGHHDEFLVQGPCLIVGRKGSIGSVFFSEQPCYPIDTAYFVHCKEDINLRFLYYQLGTLRLSELNKAAAIPGLNREDAYRKHITLPPLDVQQQIADTLDKADALRRKDQELLQKYDELAQSIFYEMFGNPSANEKGWEIVKVETVLSKTKDGTKCGPFGSALKKEDFLESGVPVWAMDNIQNSTFIDEARLFISKEKLADLESYRVASGDIIISRAGTVGKMCVVETSSPDSIISTNLIRLSLDPDRIAPEYFVSLLKFFGNSIGRLKKGADGAFTHMNTSVLCGLPIPLPPISLQSKYVRALTQVKASKELVINNGTDALFSGLLDQYFA